MRSNAASDTPSIFAKLGEALALVRKKRGLSQSALAKLAGMGKSQLSKYESGKELPKLESLERVLETLRVNYLEFFQVVRALDEEEEIGPPPTREEVDLLFANLTRSIFTLHRRMIEELFHE
jgi:transcriptional regulator with XRE-family HTH domain